MRDLLCLKLFKKLKKLTFLSRKEILKFKSSPEQNGVRRERRHVTTIRACGTCTNLRKLKIFDALRIFTQMTLKSVQNLI